MKQPDFNAADAKVLAEARREISPSALFCENLCVLCVKPEFRN